VRPGLPKLAILLLGPELSPAAHLSRPAADAFESYITNVEARLARQRASQASLREGTIPADRERELLTGDVLIEPVNGGSWEVNGGLLHHWRASTLVLGASPNDLLALLRDYSHLSRYYAPEVVSSHALTDGGERAAIAMRFRKRQVVTIVLDAEFETESGLARDNRGYSLSRSTHTWQVDQPGTVHERRRAEGEDDGFLWRLNSYWSFEQRRDGLYMECEAVSLTRDIPAGLGWLITPIIKTLPRASLEFTLTATKNALGRKHDEEARR
jgi:hypothetical protein